MLTLTTEYANATQDSVPGFSLYLDGGFVGSAATASESYLTPTQVRMRDVIWTLQ